jgi:bifunctional pyridoxal-dependent enzyme with beta-cystathionase and maltose regulon repressor activities
LLARCVEKRALLARIFVEIRKGLAILALCDQRNRAGRGRARLEAAETLLHIGEPVAAFGVFALVDEIEADLSLLGNHPFS